MQNYRVPLNDLPPGGKEFYLDDSAIWQEPMREFGLDYRVSRPLAATIGILPVEDGWLVRGTLTGEVTLPCSRCAEDATVNIAANFEDFEELPEEDEAVRAGEATRQGGHGGAPSGEARATENRLVFERNAPMLDLAAVCWEELMLALPVTPLCATGCKGLCARCGANLNEGMCACADHEGDPRLAVLRGLTLHRN